MQRFSRYLWSKMAAFNVDEPCVPSPRQCAHIDVLPFALLKAVRYVKRHRLTTRTCIDVCQSAVCSHNCHWPEAGCPGTHMHYAFLCSLSLSMATCRTRCFIITINDSIMHLSVRANIRVCTSACNSHLVRTACGSNIQSGIDWTHALRWIPRTMAVGCAPTPAGTNTAWFVARPHARNVFV